jgi:hypothetical protein
LLKRLNRLNVTGVILKLNPKVIPRAPVLGTLTHFAARQDEILRGFLTPSLLPDEMPVVINHRGTALTRYPETI